MPTIRPTMLSSCARAATAAEARFRMVGPTPPPRRSRIVALDERAADVVRRVVAGRLVEARFLAHLPATSAVAADGGVGVVLADELGGPVDLDDDLHEADMVVLVASTDDGAAAASAIGDAATRLGVMTSGLVLGGGRSAGAAIRALRPHARVLLRSEDEDDLPDVLTALRA